MVFHPYLHKKKKQERRQTCVREIDHCEEDHASSKRDSEEEKCLELLSGQPVLQVLQEGISLKKCKHTWGKATKGSKRMSEWTNTHTHKHKEKLALKIWAGPDSCASCRVQSGFTWLRSNTVWILFGRILNKAVRNSPFGRSCRCEKKIPQDNIFQMHESYLCKLGSFPFFFLQQVKLLSSTLLLWHFLSAVFSSVF